MSGLIAKAKKDTGAILDAGSYDAAVAEGHAFAQTDLIPWQKLATVNDFGGCWVATSSPREYFPMRGLSRHIRWGHGGAHMLSFLVTSRPVERKLIEAPDGPR